MDDDVSTFLKDFNIALTPPDNFSFPFPPYAIQQDFMAELYSVLENSKLGIFESPTGTGKSLSLICGCLSWLQDHEVRILTQLGDAIQDLKCKTSADSSGSDWLAVQVQQAASNNMKNILKVRLETINRNRKRIADIRSQRNDKKKINKPKVDLDCISEVEEGCGDKLEDCDCILDDVEGTIDTDEPEEDISNNDPPVKIIFCSRTHSQLSQFIGEIQRTPFSNTTRVVPMGSRQTCCINKSVKKLKSLSLMNEKCLEMLKSTSEKRTKDENGKTIKKSKGSQKCPYIKNVQAVSEAIISEVMDLEVIVKTGETLAGCPYYATREATVDSQVIVVPYNILLHKNTRESSSLNIKNAVIIIDEAHNLLDTVSHIHSTEITGKQLTYSLSQLTQYKCKYESRLSAMNLLSINQLIFVLKAIIKFISETNKCTESQEDEKLYTVSDFILSANIDNYNLFELVDFCSKSKITHKIKNFADKYHSVVTTLSNTNPTAQQKEGITYFLQKVKQRDKKVKTQDKPTVGNVSSSSEENAEILEGQPLIGILSLLANLTMDYSKGRIVVKRHRILGKCKVKYILLDPTSVMQDIVKDARSIILAGGTMQPFSEFRDRLFLACGANESRITEFSCGHVIPKENILPFVVMSGPTGYGFDFTFQQRNSTLLMTEFGRLLVNICSVVPAGVVCFFPSYDYENKMYTFLDEQGFLRRISNKKVIFREPKASSQVDVILKDYANTIDKQLGALMFSVVGGKLSEGLNFSNDLGRCIIVVGMPYPNIKSSELQEKINYLNLTISPQAGREYYENCCMKAVNQCIGRAVRHKGDYSAVLLLDQRYKSPNHLNLLPKWIMKSLEIQDKFGLLMGQLVKFFRQKKQLNSVN